MEIIKMETLAGEHLDHVAERMVKLLNERKANKVIADFNGIDLVATPDSTPESVVNKWREQHKLQMVAYKSSDGYLRKRALEQETIERMTREADALLEDFENINYEDYFAVMRWLAAIQPYSDRHVGYDLEIPAPFSPEKATFITDTLKRFGYRANENTGDAFNGEDPENFARYIIGQCIDMLDCEIHAIHGMVHRFVEQWKTKFHAA